MKATRIQLPHGLSVQFGNGLLHEGAHLAGLCGLTALHYC